MESFLIGRTQRVVLSTSTSDWINLYQGVPQGTVLGLLYFNIYVNNFKNSFNLLCTWFSKRMILFSL